MVRHGNRLYGEVVELPSLEACECGIWEHTLLVDLAVLGLWAPFLDCRGLFQP